VLKSMAVLGSQKEYDQMRALRKLSKARQID